MNKSFRNSNNKEKDRVEMGGPQDHMRIAKFHKKKEIFFVRKTQCALFPPTDTDIYLFVLQIRYQFKRVDIFILKIHS